MKTKTMLLPMVCCLPMLGSCSSLQTSSHETLGINPVYSINQTTESPNALYQLGRYYQGQMRYEHATTAYLRALAADAGFVEARNGLGVIYATQGRYKEAITEFRTAISHAPNAAHLYNNLGHVLYLQGAYTEAISTLEKAIALDPANPSALSNLSLAYAKIGAPGAPPPARVANAAATSQDAHLAAPTAIAQIPLQAPLHREGPATTPVVAAKSRLETVQLAPNIYELRERTVSAPSVTTQVSAQLAVRPVNSVALRLEVSNGNGMTGFAQKVSGFLGDRGYRTARLTNQKPFQVSVSQIQYRPGYRDEAQRLKASLPGNVELVQNNTLRVDIQARLLLGKAMPQEIAQFESANRNILVARNDSGPDKARSATK